MTVRENGMFDGIVSGRLAGVECQTVHVDKMEREAIKGTALDNCDLAAAMASEQALHRVVVPTIKIAGGRKTLVLTENVAQAERIAELFNRYESGSAGCIHSGTPKSERREIIDKFRCGKHIRLCTDSIAHDIPDTEVVVLARPKGNTPIYRQIADAVERAGDRANESGKPSLLVIDFDHIRIGEKPHAALTRVASRK